MKKKKIPKKLRHDEFRFIKCREKMPIEPNWTKKNNYKYDNSELLEWLADGKDHNYGVECGPGSLLVVDCDSVDFISFVKRLNIETFTVLTGSFGLHKYFLCKNIDKEINKINLYHPETEEKAGEIQINNTQVIGPNSLHPSGKKYEITEEHKIKTTNIRELYALFGEWMKKDDVKKLTGEKDFKETSFKKVEGQSEYYSFPVEKIIEPKHAKKARSRIQGAHPLHGGTTHSDEESWNFSMNTNKNVWHCFAHDSGGGPLELVGVLEEVIPCKRAGKNTFSDEQFYETCKSAHKKYDFEGKFPYRALFGLAKKENIIDNEQIEKIKKKDNGSFDAENYNELLSLLEREGIKHQREKTPATNKYFGDTGGFRAPRLAREILCEQNVKTIFETDEIVYYENGVYNFEGEKIIEPIIYDKLGDRTTSYYVRETLNAIRARTRIERSRFDKDPHWINLRNCILNIETGETKEHTPKQLSLYQADLEYRPELRKPKLLELLDKYASSEDKIKTIQEIFGTALYPEYLFRTAFILQGPPATGKSTLLKILEEFIGEKRVSHVPLEKLGDRFITQRLDGKLLNCAADISRGVLKKWHTFKQLTGNDTYQVERKNKDPYDLTNRATMVFTANILPSLETDDEAFWDRWVLLVLDNRINDDERVPQNKIIDKYTTEKEQSRILNWALEGLRRVLDQNKFAGKLSPDITRKKMQMFSDPLSLFIEKRCVINRNKDWTTPKNKIYDAYKTHCDKYGVQQLSSRKFKKHITRKWKLNTVRKTIDGKRKRCWIGIRVLEEEKL